MQKFILLLSGSVTPSTWQIHEKYHFDGIACLGSLSVHRDLLVVKLNVQFW